MGRRILVDTGFLVAIINSRDPDHAPCKELWARTRASLVTTQGVLVEAAHLLRKVEGGPRAAVNLILAAKAEIHQPSTAALRTALDFMDRYSNVPMDFVDALLVTIGEELGVTQIFTLDQRGFSVFRTRSNVPFSILA